jgi:hypothetical protein
MNINKLNSHVLCVEECSYHQFSSYFCCVQLKSCWSLGLYNPCKGDGFTSEVGAPIIGIPFTEDTVLLNLMSDRGYLQLNVELQPYWRPGNLHIHKVSALLGKGCIFMQKSLHCTLSVSKHVFGLGLVDY